MKESCKTCKYCCEVKKFPTYKEVLTKICVLLLLQEGDPYILEVTDDSTCECYMEYKENKNESEKICKIDTI